MGLEVSAAHHDDTITQLTMDALIIQLLENLLEVAWEIHGSEDRRNGHAGIQVINNKQMTNEPKQITHWQNIDQPEDLLFRVSKITFSVFSVVLLDTGCLYLHPRLT